MSKEEIDFSSKVSIIQAIEKNLIKAKVLAEGVELPTGKKGSMSRDVWAFKSMITSNSKKACYESMRMKQEVFTNGLEKMQIKEHTGGH